jgi:galactose mutarotase-like enzyme
MVEYSKQELQEKMIDIGQLCGIKEYILDNGPAEGVKVAEFYNGSGLTFSVLKNRGLDIADTFFKGIPLHFKTFGGITAPSQGYNQGSDFLRCFFGGLLATCGITYNGRPSRDGDKELGLHGRISNLRATVQSVRAAWEGESYVLEISGEVREAALFGPNVSLHRTIRTKLGEPSIEISDVVTNHHNEATPHSMLYHFTFGYPLIDEGARLVYSAKAIQGLADNVRDEQTTDFKAVLAPSLIHNGSGQDFLYIDVNEDAKGLASAGIVNRKLGLGVKLEYPKAQLPRLGNWQHYARGEYVTAFEPMNSGVEGREKDREYGWIEELAPGQSKHYNVKITVLSTGEELDQFEADG